MKSRFLSAEDGLDFLFEVRHDMGKEPDAQFISQGKAQVLNEFGPMFRSPETITYDRFRKFLQFSSNRHWTGLNRQLPNLTRDMKALRAAISALVDESRPVPARFDEAVNMIRGMKEGIATPILFVAYPEKYGVWNAKSEFGLRTLGLWPEISGLTDGFRYVQINHALVRVRDDFNRRLGESRLDLWTIDAYWHILKIWEGQGELEKMIDLWYLGRSR
ncbi:MAG TPA: hypothetical protein PKA27_11930 [Fimbriimonadaceae bacterium]|nr:hypothetical protein [Fimbriimonadaceae bacterium]